MTGYGYRPRTSWEPPTLVPKRKFRRFKIWVAGKMKALGGYLGLVAFAVCAVLVFLFLFVFSRDYRERRD